jgi:predicted HicB family RNase H-like nuclease
MKKITSFFALAICLSLISCGESNPTSKYFSEWENVSTDMANAISKDDIDGAKAIFDAKKESLSTQCKALKNTSHTAIEEKLIGRRVDRVYSIVQKAASQRSSQAGQNAVIDQQNIKDRTLKTLLDDYTGFCNN